MRFTSKKTHIRTDLFKVVTNTSIYMDIISIFNIFINCTIKNTKDTMPTNQNQPKDHDSIFPISKDKMFQLILDNIPARIFWKNRDSVYLGSNNLFAEDAGVGSDDSITGKTDHDLAWKKEEADFFVKIDQQVMANGKSEIGIIEPQKHADGKESWLETNKVPLTDDDGNVIGILGTYNDITERKEAVDAIKKHAANLEFKNNELEQFAFIASHDLQEPLKTIGSYIDLFESEYGQDLGDNGKVFFNYIKEASGRMQNLISGLLDYARIGRNMKLEPVDCNLLCQIIIKDLNEMIESSQARVTFENLPTIRASYVELHVIFQNLIENAIKFKKTDSTPEVHIGFKEREDHFEFYVSDNGIGIAEEFHDKVFVIYQRLHTRDKYDGTGIGLTHCKKIIDIFGGKIWLESALHEGSVFYFTIPKSNEQTA